MASATDAGETLRSTYGKENFQRLTRLLMCGGVRLLREIFDAIHLPKDLPLKLGDPAIRSQLNKAKLSRAEWSCLYPSPGTFGKSTDFDITLTFRLLRTICNLTAPVTGWDSLPVTSDLSLEADLARIKFYRNSIYGHNQKMEISDSDFCYLWKEVSEALLRIARNLGPLKTDEWEKSIGRLLTDPLTPEAQSCVEELELWYKKEMDVKGSVEHLKDQLHQVNIDVKDQFQKFDEKLDSILITFELERFSRREQPLAHFHSGPASAGITPLSVEEQRPQSPVAQATSGGNQGNGQNPSEASDIWKVILSFKESFTLLLEYLSKQLKLRILHYGTGSLCITTACSSLEILEGLWKDYSSGHLNKVAEEILFTSEVLERLCLREVKLRTVIREEDYHKHKQFLVDEGGGLKSESRKEEGKTEKNEQEENLKREMRTVKQEVARLQSQLREQELREARIVKEKEQREKDSHRELEEMAQQLRNVRKDHRVKEQQLEENLIELTEQLNLVQRQFQENNKKNSNLQNQVTTLKKELEDKDQEINELETSLSTAQNELREFQRQMSPEWVISRDQIQVTDKFLGGGGWGSVVEGKYCGCTVAVKQMHDLILSPHNRKKFEREIDIASRCRHPCLLQFIGATNDKGNPLLVTELMETSLRALLEQKGLFIVEVFAISLDVARALNYLHQKQPSPIIHRDISSANVLLWRQGEQWRAKVSDYGTANIMQHTMSAAPGAMIYSAPEAFTENQTVKIDVYSFGVLLCETCIREFPDPQKRDQQVAMVTDKLHRALIRKCLRSESEARPSTQEIIDELEGPYQRLREKYERRQSDEKRERVTSEQGVLRAREQLPPLKEQARKLGVGLTSVKGQSRKKGRHLKYVKEELTSVVEEPHEKDELMSILQHQVAILEEQLRAKDHEISELETTLSVTKRELCERNAQESPDWVIPRDQIQLTDKLLGKGGWGFWVEGKYCGCVVAVKQLHKVILSPYSQKLFERGMHMASSCRHPCLLQFIGATNDVGSQLFVTELMETSLLALLKEQHLCETEIFVISLDVARALNYLHQKHPCPILHRNVNSSNVLLWRQGEQWRAKLAGYGSVNFKQHTMTKCPGSVFYSAPEAITANQTEKVDVYSFGVLLCEMCIREMPDPQKRVRQVTMVKNKLNRTLVRRCLESDPEARPSIQEIIDELEERN